MIVMFTWANGLYIGRAENDSWSLSKFLLVTLVMLSFFFRLRLFDEIKDYEVDLKVNPTRPLARGLLSVRAVKKVIGSLLLFEIVLMATLGWTALATHLIALVYSLLMFKEFFVGTWLRRSLVFYALTHTFVCVFLGISAAVALNGWNPSEIHVFHVVFFLMNWMLFNLFEFARKTFAIAEERVNVESYSSLYGPRWAYFLSLSQALMAVLLLQASFKNPVMNAYQSHWFFLAFLAYFFLTASYLLKPTAKSAKIFRALTGLYLMAFYVLIIFILGD